jgi:anthranilate synthase component 2
LKVLIVDFQDSFTYNLAHYVESLGAQVCVSHEECIELEELNSYSHLILSPGPGLPKEKKNLKRILESMVGKKPVLGVCLGMQGIAEFYGAELYNLKQVKHGVSESIQLNTESKLFHDLPNQIEVGLYHSWAVRGLPGTGLNAIAENSIGVVMAVENSELNLFGVQFHPESVLTPFGKRILNNFLKI